MTLRLLNGLELPAIGFGSNTGPKDEEVEKVIDAAIEAGYRHIDTANIYQNEKYIGRALQRLFKSGKLRREDVFITTKLPIYGIHPDRVEFFLKQSLENLQLECVDLYLVHFPVGVKYDPENIFARDENGEMMLEGRTDHVAIWKKMEEQMSLGRTRYIGLSNYNISQIETVLRNAEFKPSCLQTEVHVYLQQRPLVDFCKANGIAVIGFQPLGSPDYNIRMKKFYPGFKKRELPIVFNDEVIKKIGEKFSKSVAQVVLRFLVQSGVIPIPKSTNPGRMKENLDIFDFELSEEDMKRMRGLDMGEGMRITTFDNFIKGLRDHPDYPYGKN